MVNECRIRWREDGAEEIVKIEIPCGCEECKQNDDDNEIFFYLSDMHGLEDLMQEDNGEDFVVLEILN